MINRFLLSLVIFGDAIPPGHDWFAAIPLDPDAPADTKTMVASNKAWHGAAQAAHIRFCSQTIPAGARQEQVRQLHATQPDTCAALSRKQIDDWAHEILLSRTPLSVKHRTMLVIPLPGRNDAVLVAGRNMSRNEFRAACEKLHHPEGMPIGEIPLKTSGLLQAAIGLPTTIELSHYGTLDLLPSVKLRSECAVLDNENGTFLEPDAVETILRSRTYEVVRATFLSHQTDLLLTVHKTDAFEIQEFEFPFNLFHPEEGEANATAWVQYLLDVAYIINAAVLTLEDAK